MPEVRVTHDAMTDEGAAAKPPRREPVPAGTYIALIVAAPLGITRGTPPLQKLAVEFQILHETETNDEAQAGRRVYQDFILEKDPSKPDLNLQRRWELRMLLDATAVSYTDAGFNSDHLVTRAVKITVFNRNGTKVDEDGHVPVFTNVKRIDSAEEVSPDDLV